MGLEERSLVLPRIQPGRVLGFFMTVPFALIAVTPYGWAWAIFGGAAIASGLPEGALAGIGMILQVVSPVVGVWFLFRRRHGRAAVMLMVQGIAWMATSWNRHSNDFIEFAVAIGIASIVVAVVVAITPEQRPSAPDPPAAEPPG